MTEICFICKNSKDGSHKSYCSSCRRVYNRKWYLKNRIIAIKRVSDWNRKNKLRCSTNMKKSRQKKPQHYRNYSKERRRLYPEKHRVYDQNRRIKRNFAKLGQVVTIAEWKGILEKHKNKCFYCRKKRKLTMDHFVPLSKGGKHVARNIVPACQECNSKKYNKMPEDYLWEIGVIPQ